MQPILARLDVLVGRWTVQPKVEGVPAAWSEFTWQDDGLFLRQVSDVDTALMTAQMNPWRDHHPFPTTTIVGLDDTAESFTSLYADARGVHRVYAMTFGDGGWTMQRSAPGFNQRFIAAVSPDVIDGRWEMSKDGETWHTDFEIRYTRNA
jgi:hypothetical protein